MATITVTSTDNGVIRLGIDVPDNYIVGADIRRNDINASHIAVPFLWNGYWYVFLTMLGSSFDPAKNTTVTLTYWYI